MESVADHSYAVAILALIEAERRHLNIETAIKLALIHDLDEAITGDFTPESKGRAGIHKINKERTKAVGEILHFLPQSLRTSYRELWNDLVLSKTNEAKLVHQLDKLELAFQASEYARTNRRHNFDDFHNSAKATIVDKRLRKILRKTSTRSPTERR
jgi:putative hydrolase of HD superfamily